MAVLTIGLNVLGWVAKKGFETQKANNLLRSGLSYILQPEDVDKFCKAAKPNNAIDEVRAGVDLLLQEAQETAKKYLFDGMMFYRNGNYIKAREQFKTVRDKAVEGYSKAEDVKGKINCTKLKLAAMTLYHGITDEGKVCNFSDLDDQVSLAQIIENDLDQLHEEISEILKEPESSTNKFTETVINKLTGTKKEKKQQRDEVVKGWSEICKVAYPVIAPALKYTNNDSKILKDENAAFSFDIIPKLLPRAQDQFMILPVASDPQLLVEIYLKTGKTHHEIMWRPIKGEKAGETVLASIETLGDQIQSHPFH